MLLWVINKMAEYEILRSAAKLAIFRRLTILTRYFSNGLSAIMLQVVYLIIYYYNIFI